MENVTSATEQQQDITPLHEGNVTREAWERPALRRLGANQAEAPFYNITSTDGYYMSS